METKSFAVVPARRGSKRLPGKNRKPFLGQPIILRVLDCLRSSGLFEEIIVSTDDPLVSEIARKAGFNVPFVRPEQLSGDFATTQEVAIHAIDWFLSSGAPENSHFLLAYPTAVFMTPEDLIQSQRLMKSGCWDHVFSAIRCPSEIQRAWWMREDESIQPVFPGNQKRRSQDFPPAFFDAGQFYWTTTNGWSNEAIENGHRRRIYELGPPGAVDINTEEDWNLAERIYQISRLPSAPPGDLAAGNC